MSVRPTNPNASALTVAPFEFESYGVRVRIQSNQQEMVDEAEKVVRRSLLNRIKSVRHRKFDHLFELNRNKSGTHFLIQNGEKITSGGSKKKFFKYFDSIIRVTIGEYALDRVFLHAGVVGWKGKAIVLPADSFKGKSTLVAELVRNGAEYYSDDFAIFDNDGLVYPFPRTLSMRANEGKLRLYELTVEELGGASGINPIPVGMVLLTEYKPDGTWRPKILRPGRGVLEMIPYVLSFRNRPDFSLSVLNSIASHAIITSGLRGSAESFAKTLLNFVDKHVV